MIVTERIITTDFECKGTLHYPVEIKVYECPVCKFRTEDVVKPFKDSYVISPGINKFVEPFPGIWQCPGCGILQRPINK